MRDRRRYVFLVLVLSIVGGIVAADRSISARGAAAAPVLSSTAGAGVSGACSVANAIAAMRRFHVLSDPQLPRPVGQVICGAFAGPGSRGMAASAADGVCLPYAGWAAFRYLNGAWQLIPGGRHDVFLALGIAKSGNDIVEKFPVRRPGETNCTASGVRARTWHWNGSRLVPGRWRVI
jgi:hypothetical protein